VNAPYRTTRRRAVHRPGRWRRVGPDLRSRADQPSSL